MILVLGESGQIATAFKKVLTTETRFVGQRTADLSVPGVVRELISSLKPRLVINAAAYTQVDRAETERELCKRLNTDLLGEVGDICREIDTSVLHFSTDYVYSGEGSSPQTEDSPKKPSGVYAETKLEGDEALLQSKARCHIIRVSWVYSSWGTNFLKTMIRLGREREELKVVSNQIGSPMSAMAIARLMAETSIPWLLDSSCRDREIFNLASDPFSSWFDFSRAIFSEMRSRGESLKVQSVFPIPSSSYPTPVERPLNSRLDDSRFRSRFGRSLPDWRESLFEVMNELISSKG